MARPAAIRGSGAEVRGLVLALSWLTVLPVRTGAPDAATAAAALRWAPLVGGLLGAGGGCWPG